MELKRTNTAGAASVGGVAAGGGGGGGGAMAVDVSRPAKPTKVEKDIQLRILMPDKSVVMVTIQEFWRTGEVYEV